MVMNQWPRRPLLCQMVLYLFWGQRRDEIAPARRSHDALSGNTNWAFSSRFQLQFGNEGEEVEERRIAFTTDPS